MAKKSWRIAKKMKMLLQPILSLFGLNIIHKIPARSILQKLDPAIIIDVGVATGTNFLINNYPDSYYYLIEPNPRYHSFIRNKLLAKVQGELLPVGAGPVDAELHLYDAKKASSFLFRDWDKFKDAEKILVPVKTLDGLLSKVTINDHESGASILLKIDTEGFELGVLKGSQNLIRIKQLRWIIVETRLTGINTYNVSELISILFAMGFEWDSVINIGDKPHGVNYLDILFRRTTDL